PVLALAGIAPPARFTAALRAAGWDVAGVLAYPDHHRYDARDLDRLARASADARAEAVVTTEKDAVRLRPLRPLPVPVAAVPLTVTIEPADEFETWLTSRLAEARAR
ncbi:MAG TPA: tetraacyldisaccharide 4'-kinase, partial [Vicinamibacterales bacterium]|nr:tetraacyldisaccharide 4'-kinase [Vicinamibacterales bacterium]